MKLVTFVTCKEKLNKRSISGGNILLADRNLVVKIFLLCVALRLALPSVSGQQESARTEASSSSAPSPSPTPLSPEKKYWLTGMIRDGGYLLEAGKTGDKSLIPALKQHLAEEKDPENRKRARMALARLGDPAQLQYAACQQYEPEQSGLLALQYIQGWFSISILRHMLAVDLDDRQHKKRSRQDKDFLAAGPSAYLILPEMVPNPPLTRDIPDDWIAEHEQRWLAWLNDNEQHLRKLEPVGEEAVLSGDFCRKFRRHLHITIPVGPGEPTVFPVSPDFIPEAHPSPLRP